MDRDELYESDSINSGAEAQQGDTQGRLEEFPLLQSPISFSAVQGIVRTGARRLGLTTDESEQEEDRSSDSQSSEHSSSEPTSQSSVASERNSTVSSNNNNMSSSVKSTSGHEFIAADSGAMFESTRTPKEEITGQMVSVKRTERGTTTKEINKTKSYATAALEHKFGLPTWFLANKDGEEEEGNLNTKDIQDTVCTIALRCEDFKRRCTDYDMNNLLLVPTLVDPDSDDMSVKWDFSKRRHLLDQFGSISQKEILAWTEDVQCAGKELEKQDMVWLMELARNSCTVDLRRRVEEKMGLLPGYHQGGTTYLWFMLKQMFKVNDSVIKALENFIKKFAEGGLQRYSGENVYEARIQFEAVCTRLDEVDRLPKNTVDDLLDGLKKSSHKEFSDVFTQFKLTKKTPLLKGAGAVSGTTLEQVQQIFQFAEELYQEYHTADEWATPTNAYANAIGLCHNCGGSHAGGWRKCPKPLDENRVKRAAEEYAAKKQTQCSTGVGQRYSGTGNSNSNYSQGNCKGYGKKEWGPPKSGEAVRKIKKRLYCACSKGCGWNQTHSTKYHDDWERDPANFKLPASHVFNIEKAKFNAVRGSNGNTDQKGDGKTKQPEGILRNGGDENSDAKEKSVTFNAIIAAASELERSSNDTGEQVIAQALKKLLELASAKE